MSSNKKVQGITLSKYGKLSKGYYTMSDQKKADKEKTLFFKKLNK